MVDAQSTGALAACIVEPILSSGGIIEPPPGYLAGVRALADQHGIVLILDEVMAGFGRAGEWFAFDVHDVVPDLITFAKGVNSGYVPVGGVIISSEIAHAFDDRVFPGGLTYSGHPLGAASIVASMNAMAEEGILIIYGSLSGQPTVFPHWPAAFKGLSLRGWVASAIWGKPERFARGRDLILRGLATGHLRPVVAREFALADIVAAHRYLESNQQVGKIVVTT